MLEEDENWTLGSWVDRVADTEPDPYSQAWIHNHLLYDRSTHYGRKRLWALARTKLKWTKQQFDEWWLSGGKIIPPKEPKAIRIEKGIWFYPGRAKPYRAFSRVGGGKLQNEDCTKLEGARTWKRDADYKAEMKGLPQRHKDLKTIDVSEVLDWYLYVFLKDDDEKTRYEKANYSIGMACEHFLFAKPVVDVTKEDIYDYIATRINGGFLSKRKSGKYRSPADPASVVRELTIFKTAINEAKEGVEKYKNIPNPFIGIKPKRFGYVLTPRTRLLQKGELSKLLDACEGCHTHNRIYAPLAIFLALETGMRQGEILSLRWKDINFDERTIKVTETKTARVTGRYTRTIVLPFWSMYILSAVARSLRLNLGDGGVFDSAEYIFKTNEEAFIQLFSDLVDRAGLETIEGQDLQFRDLRRTAATRFNNEVRLTEAEVARMLGHSNKVNITRSVYIQLELDIIREQLDLYTLKKMPLDLFGFKSGPDVHPSIDRELLLKMPMKEAFEKIPVPAVRAKIAEDKWAEKWGRPKADLDVLGFVKAHAKNY